MKSPHWWLVLLVLAIFATFLLQPGTLLFSPHSDFLADHFSSRYLFSQSLRTHHQLPLWTPFKFCGSPLLGDWQCQWFYPPNWAYALVEPLATLRMFGLQVVAHLMVGGLGMVHYLKGQRLSNRACWLGAVIFMLNGKWAAHLLAAQHPIEGWAWMPWAMASLDRLQQRPGAWETGRLVCLISLLLLGSIPAFMAISVYFLIAYGCFLLWQAPRRGSLLLAYGAACVWCATLCSVALIPAWEFIKLCTRGSGLSLEQASQGQVPWNILPALLVSPTSPLSIGWELTLYSGALTCLLAALSLFRKPRPIELFFQLTSLAVLLVALGQQSPFFHLCFRLVPGFALFRYPARYGLLLGISLGVLAARQLDQSDPLPSRKVPILLGLGALLAAYVHHTFGRTEGWLGLAVVAVAGLTHWLPLPRRQLALVALSTLELSFFTFRLIDPRPFSQVLLPHPLAQQVARPLGEGRTLVTDSQMLTSTYATLDGVELTHGSTALVPKVTVNYLESGVAQTPVDPNAVLTGIPALVPQSESFLRRGNVTQVVSQRPLSLTWPHKNIAPFRCFDFLAADGFLEMPPLLLYQDPQPLARHRLVGRALTSSDSQHACELARQHDPTQTVVLESAETLPCGPQQGAVEVHFISNQLRILDIQEVREPGAYLVISEMYYPGWVLRSDQGPVPLSRADGFFLAAHLKPGKHHLMLEYAPTSFLKAARLSGLGLLLVLALLLARTFASKR